MVLVRRGLALMRAEPEVIRRQEALGARSARAKDVEARLALAVGPRRRLTGRRPPAEPGLPADSRSGVTSGVSVEG